MHYASVLAVCLSHSLFTVSSLEVFIDRSSCFVISCRRSCAIASPHCGKLESLSIVSVFSPDGSALGIRVEPISFHVLVLYSAPSLPYAE